MFSFFRKKPSRLSLEGQLQALSACGIHLAPEATLEDLFMFHSREEHEARPYQELIPTLGFEMERRPYAPLCQRLWTCDYERIEDHGAYAAVMKRLHQMAGEILPISGITDYVDLEAGGAWVEFDLGASRIHWDTQVEDDWLDPFIIVKFDQLLKAHRTPCRIYSNHGDFGQSAFFACLTPGEFREFQKLATFKLREIEAQI